MTHMARGKAFRQGMSIVEIVQMFPTDAVAETWFAETRWPDGPVCPHCDSPNVQTGAKHKTMGYRCRACRKRFSVKTGTVMESSNLGYQTWAIAMFLLLTSLKPVSSMKLHRDMNISQKAAWHLAHRLRAALATEAARHNGPAEIDESYFGGRRPNMSNAQRQAATGRGMVGETAVVGVKDRETNEVSASVVAATDQATLATRETLQERSGFLRRLGVLGAALLVLVGCGGGASVSPTVPSAPPEPAPAPEPEPEPDVPRDPPSPWPDYGEPWQVQSHAPDVPVCESGWVEAHGVMGRLSRLLRASGDPPQLGIGWRVGLSPIPDDGRTYGEDRSGPSSCDRGWVGFSLRSAHRDFHPVRGARTRAVFPSIRPPAGASECGPDYRPVLRAPAARNGPGSHAIHHRDATLLRWRLPRSPLCGSHTGRVAMTERIKSPPKPEKPVVRIVHPGYQPGKAELEEGLSLSEGTTPQQLASAVVRSVKVRHVIRPPRKP